MLLKKYIYTFSSIAAILLLQGCVNKQLELYEHNIVEKTNYVEKLKKTNDSNSFFLLGKIYGGFEESYQEFYNKKIALDYFKQSLKLDETNMEAIKYSVDILKTNKEQDCNSINYFVSEIDKEKYYYIKGDLFLKNDCFDKNIKKAIENYDIAIKNGDTNSYLGLGIVYLKDANYKDLSKSFKYLNLAIENNHKEAYGYLAEYYRIKKDYKLAFEYALNGVIKNDSYSMYQLSFMYKFGEHVSLNNELSEIYEKMSLEELNNLPIILKTIKYGNYDLFTKLINKVDLYKIYQDKQLFKTYEYLKFKTRTAEIEKKYENMDYSYYNLLTYALMAHKKDYHIIEDLINDKKSNYFDLVNKEEFKQFLEVLSNNKEYEYNEYATKILRRF